MSNTSYQILLKVFPKTCRQIWNVLKSSGDDFLAFMSDECQQETKIFCEFNSFNNTKGLQPHSCRSKRGRWCSLSTRVKICKSKRSSHANNCPKFWYFPSGSNKKWFKKCFQTTVLQNIQLKRAWCPFSLFMALRNGLNERMNVMLSSSPKYICRLSRSSSPYETGDCVMLSRPGQWICRAPNV